MKLTTTLTALALLSAATTALATDDAYGGYKFESKSVLSPDQEVPVAGLPDPTDPEAGSDALGNGIIEFNARKTRARIRLTFSNTAGAFTRLHLHCAPAGANGPIAIGVIDLVAIAQDNSETARLQSNRVVARLSDKQFIDNSCEDAIGYPIRNLRDLAYAINAGDVYFNLHTAAFPAGELRGQIEPLY